MRQPQYKQRDELSPPHGLSPDRGNLPNGISEECEVVHYSKFGRSTSGVGQTRTLDNVRVASVKLLIADLSRTSRQVGSGPTRDIGCFIGFVLFIPARRFPRRQPVVQRAFTNLLRE
jgi:hypothetical protein